MTTPKREVHYADSTNYSETLAYVRDGSINYYFENKEKHGRLLGCFDPNISPNGFLLAYTTYYKSKNLTAEASNRRIEILNLETGVKRTIHIQSEQYYQPIWNFDGNQIAFNLWDNGWNIAIVDTFNHLKILNLHSKGDYHGMSWSSDKRTILAHNLDTLFFIDTSDIIKQKLPVSEITKGESASSATVFTLTDDKRFLVYNGGYNGSIFYEENEFRANRPDALYKYDLQDKSLEKLTPNDMYCTDYKLVAGTIYFTAAVKSDKDKTNIYTMTIEGRDLKELIKNASGITVTRRNGL